MDFKDEIISLIELKQEGAYWDFKKQWYDDNHDSDKLLDIICMANNLVNRDAYIIIGVDESNNYQFYNVREDSNRRNTQDLTNFLRAKNFAGEYRPTVSVRTISIGDCELDVIVIHNSMDTPFFLKERYKQISPGIIYARFQDGNTPCNQSADFHIIESLWKKRFGLHLSPIQKVLTYLKDYNNWEISPSYENIKYYKYAPEYTIIFTWEDDRSSTRIEYYFFDYPDKNPYWGTIKIMYHQTVLKELTGIGLDGCRLTTTAPITHILFDKDNTGFQVSYRYLIMGELNYLLHKFYANQEENCDREVCSTYEGNILIFENNQEHDDFLIYARNNWCKKDSYMSQILLPTFPQIANLKMEKFEEDYINMKILNQMLHEFRFNNKSTYLPNF